MRLVSTSSVGIIHNKQESAIKRYVKRDFSYDNKPNSIGLHQLIQLIKLKFETAYNIGDWV